MRTLFALVALIALAGAALASEASGHRSHSIGARAGHSPEPDSSARAALAAEPYPDHPIPLIVPYAAGGSSDVLGRLLGERLSESLGKQIVIDNRAGAGSRLGIEIAAKPAPDTYPL